MNNKAIFQKAMVSQNPQVVLEVAKAFEAMGAMNLAAPLYQRFNPTFGAMARGTPIAGTNGAVIPPGRYWQDMSGDAARTAWVQWTVDHPEVQVEKSEYGGGGAGEPITLSVIFTIPANASNYGLPGVWWPTTVMGFPSAADVAKVRSKADTIQRPPPMTYLDAAAALPSIALQGIQSGVQYTAETIGQAAGGVLKGAGIGLGLTKTQTIIVLGVVAALFLLHL